MEDYSVLLDRHTKNEEERFEKIESMMYAHEHILHEINGGMKVLKFIGWVLSVVATVFVFFKEHLLGIGR